MYRHSSKIFWQTRTFESRQKGLRHMNKWRMSTLLWCFLWIATGNTMHHSSETSRMSTPKDQIHILLHWMLCTITLPTTNLPRAPGPKTDEGSIAFYIRDEDNTPEHGWGGHGHGCGHGSGGGCGGHGHGCSADQPASKTSSQYCMHGQEEADNNTQFFVNNLEEVKDYIHGLFIWHVQWVKCSGHWHLPTSQCC